MKAEYENGQCDVVRSPCLYDENGKPQAHFLERFWLEVGLLQWFKNQALPLVPELRCAIEGPHPGTYPYAVIEMLPGTMLMNAFGRLPYSAKVRRPITSKQCRSASGPYVAWKMALWR